MEDDNLIKHFQKRGLIAQITNEPALIKRLLEGSITLYCGFDPTADSLHVGHLVPLLCLKRFQQYGHRPIVLVGGATGLIGDPSFNTTERKLNSVDVIKEWIEKIKHQVSIFLDFHCGNNSAIILNNQDWFSTINMLTFLRDIGKYFSVNQMINKEAVKQRLLRKDNGISFTEFSYNLLQGYDFSYLNKRYNAILQIGGSDQWGNITSGIDLTRRIFKNTVYGLTVPLINKSNGKKFGKIENDAIWLDPKKTSPYKFYQFWINTPDSKVFNFLKIFTFMDSETIIALEKRDLTGINKSYAQHILAEEVTRIVYGKEELSSVQRISNNLFTNVSNMFTENDFNQLSQDGISTITIKNNTTLQKALVMSGLASSCGQARTMIISNAITVNGKKQTKEKYIFKDVDRLYNRYTLLRRGKKNYFLIKWEK